MHRLTLILLLCCLRGSVIAQAPSDHQLNTWIRSLSVKEDPRNEKFNAVRVELWNESNTPLCQTMERLFSRAQNENIRCQIRVKYLRAGMVCSGFPEQAEDLQSALQMAYELEDQLLQYNIHLTLGQNYNGSHKYGLAVMHFRLFFEILERNNTSDFYLPAGVFYDMTYSLYHTQQYAESVHTGLTALRALSQARYLPDTELNAYQQMLQWNTIGLAYHKLGNADSAFIAFKHALRIAEKAGDRFWI